MKTVTIFYRVTTILLALMMLMAAFMYFTAPELAEQFRSYGFSDFFRIELGIAKLLGALALLLPVSVRFKEWAYFGFAVMFVSAFVLHIVYGDEPGKVAGPLFALALLAISYVTYHRRNAMKAVSLTK